ncbi:hypothetical protein B0J17DRAFT_724044 [Rhizoctonia solani]|nr:hypothetical protein B0J17DRAFT_724044 [Rhizoctonia solani]
MSGVNFCTGLSNILSRTSDSQQNPNRETLQDRMYELVLRYFLAADGYHRGVVLYILEVHSGSSNWFRTPKHVDSEDSRMIMTAYINKLSGSDIPDILIGRDPGIMLRLVSLTIDVDSQDLLPAVLEYTFDYGWAMVLDLEPMDDIEPVARMMLSSVFWMMCPPHPLYYDLTLATQKGITNTLHKVDTSTGLVAYRLG